MARFLGDLNTAQSIKKQVFSISTAILDVICTTLQNTASRNFKGGAIYQEKHNFMIVTEKRSVFGEFVIPKLKFTRTTLGQKYDRGPLNKIKSLLHCWKIDKLGGPICV